jgi:Na+/proline symporter
MKKASGALLFFGYFFSIAGGIIGIPISLIILLGNYDEESKNHARIILTCVFIAIAAVIFVHTRSLAKHLSTLLFIYIVISSILGAVTALIKKDFFSRGLFISMITGLFGVAALLFTPNSKARKGDEHDLHSWPKQRGLAPLLFITLLIFLLITKAFLP